jgi:formylglycine-generating enzyme required for sulfatase activity/energy-coupling factor transporter ATP-binding protein EcfA2
MARYALVIGISQNVDPPLKSLSKTAGDAKAVAAVLREYGDFQVEELTGRVLQTDLNAALTKFLKRADRNEAVLYYTGHAIAVEKGLDKREAYFAPSDCRVTMTGKSVTGQQNGIAFDALSDAATDCNLANLIVLLDCCHSEFLLQEALVKESFSGFGKKDYALISACRDREQAYAMRNDEHSLFTGALLDGLAKERAEADGRIKLGGLSDFIATRLKGSGQESVFLGYGRSLWLVEYRDPGAQTAIAVNETCPYQGLQCFTAATAKWYRGRDRLVDDLLQKLGESAFVPVIGASGCGKSSLVRAGLLPVLEKRGWEILGPILPGGGKLSPADKVADLLLAKFDDPDEAAEVETLLDRGNLCEAVRRLPGEQRLLLVIDQYEELFTRVAAEEKVRQFVQLLAGAAVETAGRLRIVTTMRADFMDRFLTYRELADLATKDRICWVGPMDEAQLRAAIAEPAAINGYHLDPVLLEDIIRDVEAEPNSLPLLEFALTLLWDKRDQHQQRLTIAAYRTLGRLKGALDRHAEAIFNQAGIKDNQDAYQKLRLTTDEEQQWAQRIFRRLVRTLPGTKDTRQRQLRREILDLGRDETDRKVIAKVLGKFEQGRLLVGVEDDSHLPYVDLAHEALIEGWTRFATWRQADRDVQRLVDRIVDAYNGWQAATDEDKPKFLLPEGVVAQVEAATAIGDYLSNQQEAFVRQSLYLYKPWLSPEFVIETIAIPSGKFKMESPAGQGYSTEKPEHDVSVAAFHLGKYPVTQEQWRAVALSPKVERDLNPTPAYARGDRLPVEQVSWHEAREFCARLSQLKGETYRLPSEAEWEYACRAGQPTAYCFGDDASQLDEYGWYGNNSGNRPLDAARLWQETNQDANQYNSRLNANGNRTHPVGEKKPNAWGLYDMHGNVWEWCEDEWHDTYEGAPDDGSAWTSGSDSEPRLLRGGSWLSLADVCRSAYRIRFDADYRDSLIGFRVVRVSS